ncbi:MAG TPA: carboxypeptidase regulatory-like domain-containing protein [Gemmatimonadaceae bacterium]|nr:carboxypeptidase regulatory-like domain-containing protein [Gemmatimonadaceae bacterium]
MQSPEHLDEGTVHAWLDGQLSPDEGAALEAHASACATCAALVAEARGYLAGASSILSALDGPGQSAAPPRAGADVVPLAPRAPRASAAPRRAPRRWVMPGAVAATMLLAVATTLTMRERERSAESAVTSMDRAPVGDRTAAAPAPQFATPVAPTPTAADGGSATNAARGALPPIVAPAPREETPARALAKAAAEPAAEQTLVATPAPPPTAPSAAVAQRATANVEADFSGRGVAGGVAKGMARDAAAPAAAPASPVSAAVTVTGRVTDEQARPVVGAAVQALGVGAQTDAEGRYALQLPATRMERGDSVAVTVRRIGYQPAMRLVPIGTAEPPRVDVALRSAAVSLSEVVVTSVPAEREKRLRAGMAPPTDARAWIGCWAVERPPAGVPPRVRLDTTQQAGIRGTFRVLSASEASPAPIGWWRPTTAGPAQGLEGSTRIVLLAPLPNDTVTVRRAACP